MPAVPPPANVSLHPSATAALAGGPVRPPALRRNDKVRLFAPGGAFDAAALARGVARLESLGLVPLHEPWPRRHHNYAGDAAARQAHVARAFGCTEAAALWAVRGGSGSGGVTAALAPTLARHLRTRPRWLVGFSDVTALHALAAQTGLQSLHAANLVNLADWRPAAQEELMALLGLGAPRQQLTYPARTFTGPLAPGVRGRLEGGNLTVLASLAGTGLLPDWDGALLVLEDIAEAPYRLDRALTQLVMSGALRGVKAVLLGQFTHCGAEEQVVALLGDTLAPLGIPLVGGLPFGHENSSRALPLGAQASFGAGTGGACTLTVRVA